MANTTKQDDLVVEISCFLYLTTVALLFIVGPPNKPEYVRVHSVTGSSAILMWDMAGNPHSVSYKVEKKVDGRWSVWTHTSDVADEGTTKQKKVLNLNGGETYWFRIVAWESDKSTPSDPIQFKTKRCANHGGKYIFLIIYKNCNRFI